MRANTEKKQFVIHAKVPQEMYESLRKVAHADERSVNWLVVRVLKEFLARKR